MIRFCGRRILCHQDFRFYLSTPLPKPKFNSGIASTTTIINFGVSHDTLTEDLLSRAFARIRPDLYKERVLALKNIELQKKTLQYLSVTVRDSLLTNQEAIMGSAKAVKFIMDFTNAKVEVCYKQCFLIRFLAGLFLKKMSKYCHSPVDVCVSHLAKTGHFLISLSLLKLFTSNSD